MGFMTSLNLWGAYSLRYTVTVNPRGSATISAIAVVKSVPATSGRMPNFGSAKSGVHCLSVKNSFNETSLKKPNAS